MAMAVAHLPMLHAGLALLWVAALALGLWQDRGLAAALGPARLHGAQRRWRLAAWLEAPACLGVLLSGARLLSEPHAGGTAFVVMVAAGLMAVFFNLFALWLVHKRLAAARLGHDASFARLHGLQQRLGALVLAGAVAALAGGLA